MADPVTDPRPPTTAAVNTTRLSDSGNRPRVKRPFCTTSSTPAMAAMNPDRAKAVSLARTTDTP